MHFIFNRSKCYGSCGGTLTGRSASAAATFRRVVKLTYVHRTGTEETKRKREGECVLLSLRYGFSATLMRAPISFSFPLLQLLYLGRCRVSGEGRENGLIRETGRMSVRERTATNIDIVAACSLKLLMHFEEEECLFRLRLEPRTR